jgi:uncharacterized membrane protein YfcA
MTLKNWMSVKAVICILFGIGLLILPGPLLSLYGTSLDDAGLYMSRLFGQAFVLIAILLWFARNTTEPGTQRAFALAVFVGDAIGFVVTLIAQLSGLTNALGWTTVALYLILALGFGYFLIAKPA